jgi:3,4-dihydroxy 2-butanone 4-phosphate synthase/GTP cyclohydrolase II
MSSCSAFIELFRSAKLGVLIDDAGGSRAAVVAPAQDFLAEVMNKLLTWTGGLPFVALSPERAEAFGLAAMARPRMHAGESITAASVPQYVSVEAREGVTTGISTADRAITVSILGAQVPQPRRLVQPGHIFPVETREGGVLVKTTIAEGAIDLARLAGFTDACLFIDLLNERGELMNEENARRFAAANGLPLITLTEIVEHRLAREPLVTRVAEARLPTTAAGEVKSIIYRSKLHDVEHIALVKGEVAHGRPVLVRVQGENTVADVFGGPNPSSRHAIRASLKAIGERGEGVLIYLRRPFIDDKSGQVQLLGETRPGEGRSAVLMREYGVGAQILRDLGVTEIELLTGSTRALGGLTAFGLRVVSQIAIPEYVPSAGECPL